MTSSLPCVVPRGLALLLLPACAGAPASEALGRELLPSAKLTLPADSPTLPRIEALMFVLLALALLGCSTEAPPAPPATPPATAPAEPPAAAADAATATDAAATDAAATDPAATDAAATDPAATAPPAEGATTSAADPSAPPAEPAPTPGVAVVGAPVKPGTGVKVGGAFTYAGKKTGAYRVDLMTVKSGVPSLVVGLTLAKPGAWSVEVPKGLDKVDVMAYVDVDGKGPSDTDPMGVLEGVSVSNANSAVNVTVTDPTGK